MGADLDAVERDTVLREQVAQPRVDLVELGRRHHPSADRRLVGQDDEPEPETLELAQRLDGAGDQAELVRPEHVADLLVDRAVAVQQDEPATHDGLHTRSPDRASTPWERNANAAN